MNNQLSIEERGKRIEKVVKVVGVAAVCIALSPVYVIMLHGMAALTALIIFTGIGSVAMSFLPVAARWLANMRLKALKAVAAANPIETLENIFSAKKDALDQSRDSIKQFQCVVNQLYASIQEHDEQYPNTPSPYNAKYQKLEALLVLRGKNYEKAYKQLGQFHLLIDEKRSDWKIAQSFAKANELAKVGEDFTSQMMQDQAVGRIQDGLNMAFAELDASLLDERAAAGASETIQAVVVEPSKKQLPEKAGPPTLDILDTAFESTPTPAPVAVKRRK